jgi:hypothetical protein
MKKIVALTFLLVLVNGLTAQETVKMQKPVKMYTWEQAQKAFPDTIYGITFRKEKLQSLPDDLMKYVQLKKLDLSKNKLTSLPTEIIHFKKLEVLDLGKNRLEVFPLEICQLVALKKLSLNRNYFSEIPNCIRYLSKLEQLDMWDVPLSTFPNSMEELIELKLLDVRGIVFGPIFQSTWREKLPDTKIEFDPPCNCAE